MSRLAWSAFKRTAPSSLTSLASIAHPDTHELPADRASSLDNLCTAFIRNGLPPAPALPVEHQQMVNRVAAWSHPVHPSTPADRLDNWKVTAEMVEEQCTRQFTNTAPGPDALLPVFLKFGGPTLWKALAILFSFSWKYSVTPQAWREANVMALYKGEGDKADMQTTTGPYR